MLAQNWHINSLQIRCAHHKKNVLKTLCRHKHMYFVHCILFIAPMYRLCLWILVVCWAYIILSFLAHASYAQWSLRAFVFVCVRIRWQACMLLHCAYDTCAMRAVRWQNIAIKLQSVTKNAICWKRAYTNCERVHFEACPSHSLCRSRSVSLSPKDCFCRVAFLPSLVDCIRARAVLLLCYCYLMASLMPAHKLQTPKAIL